MWWYTAARCDNSDCTLLIFNPMIRFNLVLSSFIILSLFSCTSENGVQDISFTQPDTLVIKTNENFLTFYDRSYTSTTEEGQTIFYGFNHKRNTLDRINLTTGQKENFKPCDPSINLYSGSAVGVYGDQIVFQNHNLNYQVFQLNPRNACLELISQIDSKTLAGNSSVINPIGLITIVPNTSPAFLNDEFVDGFYPFQFEQIPRVTGIKPTSKTTREFDIPIPAEIKERLRPFSQIAKPVISSFKDGQIAFFFSFSDLVFTYHLEERKLNLRSVPGKLIKGEIELPDEKETLLTWQIRKSSFFHHLIWDSSNKVFYRVEVYFDPEKDADSRSLFHNRHYLSIISEDLQLLGEMKIPDNCFSIPIPMNGRLYFMLNQDIEEDAIMFIGVTLPIK